MMTLTPIKDSRGDDHEKRIQALEKHSHEPFDFTDLVNRLERLESKVFPKTMGEKEGDCSFYYFKPGGKWKYEGRGWFPTSESFTPMTRNDIKDANNGSMPGISSDGNHYMIVIIPDEDCKAKYAYPRFIHPIEDQHG